MTAIAMPKPFDWRKLLVPALLAAAFITLAFFAARFGLRSAAAGSQVPVVPCRQCSSCSCPRLAGSTLCGCPR